VLEALKQGFNEAHRVRAVDVDLVDGPEVCGGGGVRLDEGIYRFAPAASPA